MKRVEAIAKHPAPWFAGNNLTRYGYEFEGSARNAIKELIANLLIDLEQLAQQDLD